MKMGVKFSMCFVCKVFCIYKSFSASGNKHVNGVPWYRSSPVLRVARWDLDQPEVPGRLPPALSSLLSLLLCVMAWKSLGPLIYSIAWNMWGKKIIKEDSRAWVTYWFMVLLTDMEKGRGWADCRRRGVKDFSPLLRCVKFKKLNSFLHVDVKSVIQDWSSGGQFSLEI